MSERGRGPAGTGREQVPMDKDQAGTGRSGRKQVLVGGKLVSRAAADEEQPWIGREKPTMRRKEERWAKINREQALIGKVEQVGMCREKAQEGERRQQKTGMDRDG